MTNRRPGRPPSDSENPKRTLYIELDDWKSVRGEADALGLSVSEYILKLHRAHKAGEPELRNSLLQEKLGELNKLLAGGRKR